MTGKAKTILGVAAFALCIAAAAFAYNVLSERISPQSNIDVVEERGEVQSTSAESEAEKIKAIDFTVLDSEGNSVKLSDMFGKPIVLNFWASWCPPCKTEMPDFNKVYGELGGEISFMMVDLVDGQRETKEKGEKYVSDQGFSFPVYYDVKQEAAYAYGVSAIPTTIFIDKDGYIVTGAQGAIDEKTLRRGIEFIFENESGQAPAESSQEASDMKTEEYHKISAKEARKRLGTISGAILLDVRTEEEYREKRIEGAVLIPDYELKNRAETELPDKDAVILVYCRSGNRSKKAAELLVSMGYTNVYDFGGINDYPYDTVSD